MILSREKLSAPADLSPRVPGLLIIGVFALSGLPLLFHWLGMDLSAALLRMTQVEPDYLSLDSARDALLHTLLEWVSIVIALLSGVLAFSHYTISRNIIAPILGISLFCAALMDFFHSLVAIGVVITPVDMERLLPFLWAMARIVSAAVLLAALVILSLAGTRYVLPARVRLPYFLGGVFFILSCLTLFWVLHTSSVPQTIYAEALLKRPLDIVPLLLNGAVGLLLWGRFRQNRGDVLSESLALSLVPLLVAELCMVFGSGGLFDHYAISAHLLKIVCYAVPFLGLLLDYHYTHKLDRLKTTQLHDTYRELQSRTHELVKSHRNLEESNRFKSEFLAGVTHELRTPLNSVIGFSRVLLKSRNQDQDSKELRAVEAIYRNSTHLLGLINEILDLSKIEVGRMSLEKSEFVLNDIVQEVVNMLEPLAEKKRLSLQLLNYARNLELVSDASKLRQILINLGSNAVKYTERGSVVICVETAQHEHLGEVVQISVRDTGIGIRDHEKGKLFVEFSRTEDAKNSGVEGTGLGLMITAKLTELLGGLIEFDSEYGVGSEFRVYFPVSDRHKTALNPSASPAEVLPLGVCVVCGEADPDSARYLEIAFDQEGVHAFTAATSKQLVLLAEEHMPDVIFFDTAIAGGDQQQLLSQLATHQLLKDIPRVAMSSNYDGEKAALEQGANLFLAKPFQPEDLMDVVWRLVYRNISSVILVGVEDVHRDMLVSGFDKMLVHTFFVPDHRVALEKLGQFLPDLLVVNLGNPRLEAARLLVALSNDEHHSQLPIVVYNGLNSDFRATYGSHVHWEIREVAPACQTIVDAFLGVRRRILQRLMHIERVNRMLQAEQIPSFVAPVVEAPADMPDTHILVVDAAADSAALIGWLLQDIQLSHDLVAAGREALKMVLEKNYKLIFIALDLPDIAGREVLRRLRATNSYRNTPIVAINSDESVPLAELQQIGFTDALPRPIDGDRLLDVLSQHIELHLTG